MKILIVSFVDDNFGDNIIRICFEKLLRVVLQNLNIEEYEIRKMPLKEIKEELICDSDMIFFAGGGLLGLSYLDFFYYLDKILEIADRNNIPVVFSSVGVNNMDGGNDDSELKELLNRKCIKAISVRENLEFFQNYMQDREINICQVCDPALWARYVYDSFLEKEHIKYERDIVGINVVRGGLFKANGKDWKMKDELKYLFDLKQILDANNVDYRFYTNGSVLDNNTLRYFVQEYEIPKDKVIHVHSSSELVKTIAAFSKVYAIRMHSSIITHAFSKPCLSLIWNDKVEKFYQNINRADCAISITEWNAKDLFIKMEQIGKEVFLDSEYLMSLYRYLYQVLAENSNSINEEYSFEVVIKKLKEMKMLIEEDICDYQVKLEKGEKQFLKKFIEARELEKELKEKGKELKAKDKELKAKDKELKDKEKELIKKEKNIEKKKNELQIKKNDIKSLKKELRNKETIIEKQKSQLDKFNSLWIIKVGRKIKSVLRKIVNK